MFVKKSNEEFLNMSATEQAEYLTAKETHEKEQIQKTIEEKIEEAQKNNAPKEDVESMKQEIVKLNKNLEETVLRFKSLSEQGFKYESFENQVEKSNLYTLKVQVF